MNYYEILNVNKNATKKQIRNAYKQLVIKFHPDKYHGSDIKIKDIINAYTTLSNDKKREEYDHCHFYLDTFDDIIKKSDIEFIKSKINNFELYDNIKDDIDNSYILNRITN